METPVDQLLDAWRIHNRIHLYLLDALADSALHTQSGGKGRTVGDVFAHIHNVRLMWLQAAAPDLMEGLSKLEKVRCTEKPAIVESLVVSGAAIENLLRRSFETGGNVKGFKPSATAFLGYLISHESHHRGQITLMLKDSGSPLDAKTDYGMWEWGVR